MLLTSIQSIDILFNSFVVLCENEYIRTSNDFLVMILYALSLVMFSDDIVCVKYVRVRVSEYARTITQSLLTDGD